MNKAFVPITLIICAYLMLTMRFSFIFFFIALLPALMVFFTDTRPQKPLFRVILMCNVAAALPFFSPAILAGFRFRYVDVSQQMADPATWLFIYAGAAAGWGAVFFCRMAARLYYSLHYDYQLSVIARNQKRLVDEWGEAVKGDPARPN